MNFVPIADAALAVAGHDRLARCAVLDLYEYANRTGYAAYPWEERELAAAWGMGRKAVVSLLEHLAAAGCIRLERSEPRSRQKSTLWVIDPVNRRRNQTGNQTGNQNRNQNVQPPMPDFEDEEPVWEPEQEPDLEPPRAVLPTARASEQILRTEPQVGGGVGRAREGQGVYLGDTEQLALDRAELLELQQSDEPQHGMASERDVVALTRELARGRTKAALRIVWDWTAQSDHPQARACRDNNWRRWASICKRPLFEERLAAALEWDAAGRPAARATGPPRSGGGSSSGGAPAADPLSRFLEQRRPVEQPSPTPSQVTRGK